MTDLDRVLYRKNVVPYYFAFVKHLHNPSILEWTVQLVKTSDTIH